MSDHTAELPEPLPELPPEPHHDSITIGPYGLRAGWSIAIFFAVIAICVALIGIGVGFYHHSHPDAARFTPPSSARELHPTGVLLTHGLPVSLMLLASWVVAKIERRRFGVFGLGGHARLGDFIKGLFTGLFALSLLVAILWSTKLLVINGFNVSGQTALLFGLKWLAAFSLVGFAEEYMFRGYLQYTLTRGLGGILPAGNRYRRTFGFWLAATLLSCGFFAGHTSNSGESPIGLLAVFLVGFVLAYSLWRTGSLWWAIGLHITWDWSQSFLYGVGDSGLFIHGRLLSTHPAGRPLYSGGLTGPEGSLFVLPILVLLVLIIRFTLPQREQPPLVPELLPSAANHAA